MPFIQRRGLMLILSSPSGAGKTTLARILLQEDQHIHTSISYTTRPIRPGEVNGVHYYFVNQETFKDMINNGEFLEYAQVYNNLYGTPKKFVEEHLNRGEDVLFDIEWQGAKQLRDLAHDDVVSVFIFPPSRKELLRRLVARGQDSNIDVEYRTNQVNSELQHWVEYDYSIINRSLEESMTKLLSILRAERLKKARRLGVPDFVAQLMDEVV